MSWAASSSFSTSSASKHSITLNLWLRVAASLLLWLYLSLGPRVDKLEIRYINISCPTSDSLSPPLLPQCAGLCYPGTALDSVTHCQLIRHHTSPHLPGLCASKKWGNDSQFPACFPSAVFISPKLPGQNLYVILLSTLPPTLVFEGP